MPSEPEKKVEDLLKAYAQRRREDAGAPLELHPATRRLLQSEAARLGLKRESEPLSWLNMVPQFWPRVGLAVSVFVLLGALTWIFVQFSVEERQLARLKREEALSSRLAKALPAPARPDDSKSGALKPEALDREASAKTPLAMGKEAKDLPAVPNEKNAAGAEADSGRKLARQFPAAQTSSPAPSAKPAEARLAGVKAGQPPQLLAQTQSQPPSAPLPSQARPLPPTEPRTLARTSPQAGTSGAPSTSGDTAKGGGGGMALALRDAAVENRAKVLEYDKVQTSDESKPSAVGGARLIQPTRPVASPESSTVGTSVMVTAGYLETSSTVLPRAGVSTDLSPASVAGYGVTAPRSVTNGQTSGRLSAVKQDTSANNLFVLSQKAAVVQSELDRDAPQQRPWQLGEPPPSAPALAVAEEKRKPAAPVTERLAYGVAPARVPAPARGRSELTSISPELGSSKAGSLAGPDTIPTRKDFYRANDTLKPDFAGRSAEEGGLLASFELEQAGDRIRILEQDGSVYEGQVAVLESGRTDERLMEALDRKLADKTAAAGKRTTNEWLDGAAVPSEMRGSPFRASGTSRRLNQYVVINGTLLADDVDTQKTEPVSVPTTSIAAAGPPGNKAPVASPAPVLSRAAPAKTVSGDQSRALGVVSRAAVVTSQPSRAATPVRLRGKALIGGTNEVRIDAVRVRP